MFYIYILYATRYDKFYIGYTSNYRLRLQQHNHQQYFNTFTSKYRPWELAAVFECGPEERDAIKLERFIKRQKSRKLLMQLSDPQFLPTDALARLVRVPDVRD